LSRTFKITNGDIGYGVGGQPLMTRTGKDKLSQDLAEAAQSDVDDIGFGFGIPELVGRVEEPDTIPSLLDDKITSGITRLQTLQEQNQGLIRGDDERINSIASIQTGFNAADSRTDFAFSFAVRTEAAETIRKRGSVAANE
jgi:hypothetical protein